MHFHVLYTSSGVRGQCCSTAFWKAWSQSGAVALHLMQESDKYLLPDFSSLHLSLLSSWLHFGFPVIFHFLFIPI